MALKWHTSKGLCKTVSPVILALHPGDFENSIGDQLADMELPARDVFGARVQDGIMRKGDRAGVVQT